MKKIALILLLLMSCKKIEITPTPNKDIFATTQTTLSDNSDLLFKLDTAGTYILKLSDKNTGQVLTKERIVGKAGENNIKIYIRSLNSKYLYLTLSDGRNTLLKETTIIIN